MGHVLVSGSLVVRPWADAVPQVESDGAAVWGSIERPVDIPVRVRRAALSAAALAPLTAEDLVVHQRFTHALLVMGHGRARCGRARYLRAYGECCGRSV